jgi:hypothetical protein
MARRDVAGKRVREGHAAIVVLAAMLVAAILLAAPASAAGHGWRRIATDVKSFVTDGVRYAAWKQPGLPITLLDTYTGRRVALPPGCSEAWGAAGGRLLIECDHREGLFDIRTRSFKALPAFEHAPWFDLGLYYVAGRAPSGSHCGERPTHDECDALYDLRSGKVTLVPKLRMSDLDRPGAPPLCRAVRERLLAVAHNEGFEAFDYVADYERGLLVTLDYVGERPLSQIRIDRCHGRPTVVHTRPTPFGIELRGGILMWTALTRPEEPLGTAEEIERTRGEVEAYFVASGTRLNWTVPRVPIRLRLCGEPTPVGVDGEADHTDRTVFWLAVTGEVCGEKGGAAVDTHDLYARPLR